LRRGEPADAIAANVVAPLQSMVGADARGGEFTAIAAPFGAPDQLTDPVLGDEAVVDGNTAPQEVRTRSLRYLNAHGVPVGRGVWPVPVVGRASWACELFC
jgi:hypothetical protein